MLPLSTSRALSGIYRELRQLRRLYEAHLHHLGADIPASGFYDQVRAAVRDSLANLSKRPESESEQEPDADVPVLTEEQLAEERIRDVVRKLAAGEDPGTDYRPWD